MKTRKFSYVVIILVIYVILGDITYCGASIPQNNYMEVFHKLESRSDTVWEIMTRLFGREKISNQNLMIYPRVAHVMSTEPDARRRPNPEILKWNIEVNNKIYSLYINRDDETVTVKGEAEDWKEKEKVEHVLKMRAPSNFCIINEIDVSNDLS